MKTTNAILRRSAYLLFSVFIFAVLTFGCPSFFGITGKPFLLSVGFAQDATETTAVQKSESAGDYVASVGDKNITATRLEFEIKRLLKGEKPDEAALTLIRAGALEQLIKQALVTHQLQDSGYWPNPTQLEVRIDLINEQLQDAKTTLAEHLEQSGISMTDYRDDTAWRIGWQKYLDQYMTDENVERYFDKHRPDFDGRKVYVAHLLIKVGQESKESDWQAAHAKAESIRKKIVANEITFSEAAAQFSQSPTAAQGGDIGFIERNSPMTESFSKAAFALQENEVSAAVVTPFGVHLIHCIEIESGKATWQDKRTELEIAMRRFLFEWNAQRQRKKQTIKIIAAIPYFDPDSGKLIHEAKQ